MKLFDGTVPSNSYLMKNSISKIVYTSQEARFLSVTNPDKKICLGPDKLSGKKVCAIFIFARQKILSGAIQKSVTDTQTVRHSD